MTRRIKTRTTVTQGATHVTCPRCKGARVTGEICSLCHGRGWVTQNEADRWTRPFLHHETRTL